MSDRMIKVLLFNMCMIIDKENNKVLVQDKVHDEWNGYTFPGGHIEPSESFIDSTIREVKEETGLSISNLEPCGVINWDNSDSHDRWLIFLYKTSSYEGELLHETEEGRIFWLDYEEFISSKKAFNMDAYMKLFNGDHKEAYATWQGDNYSDFTLI